MILYFTGSGNSEFAAEALAERLGDETVSINETLKSWTPLVFESEKPFVLVAPVYAWRLPRVIERFIEKAEFKGSRDVYTVVTMGGQSGKCDEYTEKLFNEKGMNFMGLTGIKMPDNYVVMYKMPDRDEMLKALDAAVPVIDSIADDILNGKRIHKTDSTPGAALKSSKINTAFYRHAVDDRKFSVSDSCNSCGLCERMCAVSNIEMHDGKPGFLGHCEACYACLHHCPKAAIDVKGKSEKHGRYLCMKYSDYVNGAGR